MRYPADTAPPFIVIDIHGKIQPFTPDELARYFNVNFTPTNIIPDEVRLLVTDQIERARQYYENDSPADPVRGRTINQQRLHYIPPDGIQSIPENLYLKVITLQGVPQVGVFASQLLSIGTWIGVYAGELFPVNFPRQSLHAMAIIDPYVQTTLKVDAKNWGNHARFCNHSYSPNVTRKLVFYQGMYHVILHTIRPVQPHQQLLYDYGKNYWQHLGFEPEDMT